MYELESDRYSSTSVVKPISIKSSTPSLSVFSSLISLYLNPQYTHPTINKAMEKNKDNHTINFASHLKPK